eukprot:jgi/Psemu1/317885/estExt_fgenesh1_pm.C_330001
MFRDCFYYGREERGKQEQEGEEPEKYSEAYFEDRILHLQSTIQQAIPSKEDIDSDCIFYSIIESLEAAKQALDNSKAVVVALQNEQNKHPGDEDWKAASLVDPARKAAEEAQITVERLEEAGTNAGCAIVKSSKLIDDIIPQIERDLLECTVLIQATPKKLANWCAESPGVNPQLLGRFLGEQNNSTALMENFLVSGGPSDGNYGMALTIYDKLRAESHALQPMISPTALALRERLALAVALELATPIPVFHQEGKFVDPVERFRYYAKFAPDDDGGKNESRESNNISYTDKLDEAFYTLSVWELRKVVSADATHDDLTWGRAFLRNYRPDQIYMKDQKWRYIMSVRTDVGYRQPDHEFSNYPEMLSAGGECGPRAFFGRFISKAWGIPTWGVRQQGHAALSHWTNDGWTVCLGAGWQYSWWDDNRYGGTTRHGPDFLEETKARASVTCPQSYYKQIVLLECLAESLGETVEEDFVPEKMLRSLAISQRKMATRAPCSKIFATADNKDRDDSLGACSIVIPADSFVDPKESSSNVLVMKSFEGGNQVHLEHDGQVEYELPLSIATSRSFAISVKVVNVHRNQKPIIAHFENTQRSEEKSILHPNDDCTDGYEIVQLPQGQEIEVQYTKGKWEQTTSIRIELSPGGRLRLSRKTPCWGLSMKEIILQPL